MTATFWYCVAEHELGIDSSTVEALDVGRAKRAFREHFELDDSVQVSAIAMFKAKDQSTS